MKKIITLLLVLTGMVSTASATTLHIGVELNYTGNVKVHRFGGTSEDVWANDPTATLEGSLYGRRWYSIDMNGNTSAIVRMEENNWNDRGATVTDISGDDCYMYVSTSTSGNYVDGQKVWNTGKLSSKGWQTMKFSNDVDGKWDDEAYECTKVDDNTFTYTLTKTQIQNANKSTIYFRFKLADGVFFVGSDYWGDHYFRIGSNDGSNGNVSLDIANSITNNSYTTDQQKNWYVSVPTYDYEKLVFTIKDVTSGTTFGNSTWKVSVDAYISKTVSATYDYATFGTSVPVDLSGVAAKGVTAYSVTANAATGKVTKTEKTDVLAANKGVLLENLTNADITLSLPVSAAAAGTEDNEMIAFTGTGNLTQPTSGNDTYYILANETAGVGFYKVNTEYGNAMGTNTAYLKVTGTNARPFFWFDESTGINAVKNTQMSGEAYNLAGQRVTNPTKGLYIVNGKKVIKN